MFGHDGSSPSPSFRPAGSAHWQDFEICLKVSQCFNVIYCKKHTYLHTRILVLFILVVFSTWNLQTLRCDMVMIDSMVLYFFTTSLYLYNSAGQKYMIKNHQAYTIHFFILLSFSIKSRDEQTKAKWQIGWTESCLYIVIISI